MDRPTPQGYEILRLFLELWESEKGEQAGMPVRPSDPGCGGRGDHGDPCESPGLPSEPGDRAPINRR